MIFRILLGLDIAAAIIAVYFFIVGLADGSVSSFNMTLWIGILAGIAVIIGGGMALRQRGRTTLANLVLLILALPIALYGFFLLVVILTGERWN